MFDNAVPHNHPTKGTTVSTNPIMDVLKNLFENLGNQAVRNLVDARTVGQTTEERLRFVEEQAQRNEASIEALNEVARSKYQDLSEEVDVGTNVLMGGLFALAGHVLGRTFTADEIDEIASKGVDRLSPEDSGLEAGQYIAEALRDYLKG